MKSFTKSLTLLLIGILASASVFAGEFVAKPYSYVGLGKTSKTTINLSMTDLFEYPAELAKDANLSIVENLSVSIVPQNTAIVDLYKYEYYTYGKAQYLYLYQMANQVGKTSVDVIITYNGKEVKNTLQFDFKEIIATNDSYPDVSMSGSFSAAVVTNDQSMNTTNRNKGTLTITKPPVNGTAVVVAGTPSTILYTPNSGLENYTTDSLKYTLTLESGATSSASAKFFIHENSYASKMIEFLPAPGQFTNEAIAKKGAAEKILGNTSSMISLGGFGGYVILGFDQPIVNRPENPYGVDFSIKGNSFVANLYGVWTEPAAVQVMKDLNGDGIPNDGEWYELAGSDYYLATTKKNVEMTYYNPHYTVRYTIPWSTNHGEKGALLTNTFHQHAYYPDPFDFGCDRDSLTYSGNMIVSSLDMSSKSYVNFYRAPAFGYSDNRGYNKTNLCDPLNPYYNDAKGNAGDGFDLDWAVDKNGNSVKLDTVHFVKVYTAGSANAGWLGEWSSEVLGVGITTPDPNYVAKDYYLNYIGITQLKVIKGQTCQYEGFLFKNGRPSTEGTPTWWTSDPNIGTVDNTGKFTAKANGATMLYFQQKSDAPKDSISVKVVELKSVVIEMEGNSAASSETTSLILGETIYITAQCEDNIGDVLNGNTANRFTYETFDWVTTNPEIGTINNGLFKGTKVGETKVYAISRSNPALKDSIVVTVKEIPQITDKITGRKIEITEAAKASGSFKVSDLFTITGSSLIYLNTAKSKNGSVSVRIENNQLFYDFFPDESKSGYNSLKNAASAINDVVTLNITSYGVAQDVDFQFVYNDGTTGIETDKGSSIFAYPNPFVDYVIVNSNSNEVAQLYDMSGKCVIKYNLNVGENKIETSNLSQGSYILKTSTSTIKLLK